jgi:hypothetical protein
VQSFSWKLCAQVLSRTRRIRMTVQPTCCTCHISTCFTAQQQSYPCNLCSPGHAYLWHSLHAATADMHGTTRRPGYLCVFGATGLAAQNPVNPQRSQKDRRFDEHEPLTWCIERLRDIWVLHGISYCFCIPECTWP